MFRIGFLILSGNAAASLLLLVRNLIVARLIPVEDYGIAATFGVVMTMVEMASSFGLQQQMIQSEDGDDSYFQAAIQGFQVLRGLIAGIVLYLVADPIARFLEIPEVIWAYQLLALVPVIKAFEHFDVHRFSRKMQFGPMILTGTLPALLSLLVAWPLIVWLGDWRVVLYAILVQIGLMVSTSHLCAERPYQLIFDRAIMARSLQFGWPILATAILLFLVFQGDKIIVGRVLGMEALAIFAMGVTLTQTPVLVLERSAQNFFLPQLSKNNRHLITEPSQFQKMAIVASEAHMLLGVAFSCVVAIFGELIIDFILGLKFEALIPIFTMLAVLHSLRALKGGPSVIALAKGQNVNTLAANIIRVLLLPIGYLVIMQTGRIDYIIIVAIFGEILGLIVALFFMSRLSKVNLGPLITPFFISFLIFTIAIFTSYVSIAWIVWMLWIVMLALLFGLYFLMKDLRLYIKNKAVS